MQITTITNSTHLIHVNNIKNTNFMFSFCSYICVYKYLLKFKYRATPIRPSGTCNDTYNILTYLFKFSLFVNTARHPPGVGLWAHSTIVTCNHTQPSS